jgi:putative acetyltransferase
MQPDTGNRDIRITPATGIDVPRLNELVNIPEISRYLNLIPPVPPESTRAFLEKTRTGEASMLCIRKNDRIIGATGLVYNPQKTKISHTAAFYLYLEPAFWGRGIGRVALQHLLEIARNEGLIRVECQVSGENDRALRLYERVGFVREGLKKKAFCDDGEFSDMVVMGRLFE